MGIRWRTNVELADPNRTGIGPMPNDLAITYNEDQNMGVGVPYTRAAEFLPATFSKMLSSQFDNDSQPGAANPFSDIHSKITYDRDFSSRYPHAELTALFTRARMLRSSRSAQVPSQHVTPWAVAARSLRTMNYCRSSRYRRTHFGAMVTTTTWSERALN